MATINNLEQYLIGLTKEEAIETVSDLKIFHTELRILDKESCITCEYKSFRLNLVLDENKVVIVYYG